MIFLIQYDRPSGRVVSLQRFRDRDRKRAEDTRLALELELKRSGVEREVVILEAKTEDILRRTHRRYFEKLEDLAKLPPAKK